MDVFEFVKAASDQGAEVVQIADNLPLHKMKTKALERLVEVCSKLGLAVEVGTRGLRLNRVKKYLEIAQMFEAPFLRLVVDDKAFEPTVEKIIRDIQELLPLLQKSGVKLAIENHDRFRSEQLASIIRSTDQGMVGICLDTANSLGAGEGIEEAMRHLAPYTLNLHVKDFVIKRVPSNMGFTISGCPAGSGVINIPNLLDRLSGNQHFYSLTLEVWSDLLDDLPQTIAQEQRWVRRSMDYLSTVVDNYQKVS